MEGMAWTLHPALFYEKYGSVLGQLWDSGALRTVSSPFRRLSASLGAAVSSGVGSRRLSAEVDEASSSGLVFSGGTPVTQDLALSNADRDVVEASEEPSTSQRNELAFRRDMYVARRHQETQQERLRRMHESRKKLKSSSVAKPRRRSSILAPPLGKKKGKYSQLMTFGTPLAELQEFVPRLEGVTMGVVGYSSTGSPVETEPEDDDLGHASSAHKYIDNDTMRCTNPTPRKLRSTGRMPSETATSSQENEVKVMDTKGEEVNVITHPEPKFKFKMKVQALKRVPRGVQQDFLSEAEQQVQLVEYSSDMSKPATYNPKNKRRRAVKKALPPVDVPFELVVNDDSNDESEMEVSRSKRNVRRSSQPNESPNVSFLKEEQDTAALEHPSNRWDESKQKSGRNVHRTCSPNVDMASTEASSGPSANYCIVSDNVLKNEKKTRKNPKRQVLAEHGGTSAKPRIDAHTKDALNVSGEANVPDSRSKGQNEMLKIDQAEASVDAVKPKLSEECRKPHFADASPNKRKSCKDILSQNSPKIAVTPLDGSDGALPNLLWRPSDNKMSKPDRNRPRDVKGPYLPKASNAPTEDEHEADLKEGGQDKPHVDGTICMVSSAECSTTSIQPTIDGGWSDSPQWSTTTGVSKLKSKGKKHAKSSGSSKVSVVSVETISKVGRLNSQRNISRNVKPKSNATFLWDIKNIASLGSTVTLKEKASDASPKNSLRSWANTDVSKREGAAREDTKSTISPKIGATPIEHEIKADWTGFSEVLKKKLIPKCKTSSKKHVISGFPKVSAASTEPEFNEGSNCQPQATLDADYSGNKTYRPKGVEDPDTVKDGVTSMEPGPKPLSKNTLQALRDSNLSTRNDAIRKETDTAASSAIYNLGQSCERFMRSWQNETNVVSVRTPATARTSLDRSKAVQNPRSCFIPLCGLAERDFKPYGIGGNSNSSDKSAMKGESNDARTSRDTQQADTSKMLGALRRRLFKRSNSDTAHLPVQGQQSPNEQWAAWLTGDFDDQRSVSRRVVSVSPEEEHLRRRLAAWDPFQEESYALYSPDSPDFPQKESFDALVPLGLPHETKREVSLSMASIRECDSGPSRTIRSNESPLYGMTTDPNLYDDMHWIMESDGACLAASSQQQFPSSPARPPDVNGGTPREDGRRPVTSHPAPCASQVRSKIAAADDIAETLSYTVHNRHHNHNLTTLQGVPGGWKSSSESFGSKSCEDSFTLSAKGAQPVRGAQRLSGATRSSVVPVEVHPRETRASRRLLAPPLQGPRPEEDVQGASMVTTPRDVTVYSSDTPEGRASLRRGKPKHTKARNKQSTKKTKEPKNRKPPQNCYYRGLETGSKDNEAPHDGDVVSAIASASAVDSIHRTNRLVDIRRLPSDSIVAWSELTFSEPECVTVPSAGEVRVCINLTSKRKRTMVWPFRLFAP